MTTITKRDAINGAMSIADDVAEGRLSPATLEAQLQTELRALVGTVIGEGDPLFALQVEIARGVLAVGGVPADELAEWLAVARHRAGEPVSQPDPDQTPPEPVSLPTVALIAESVEPEAVTDVPAEPVTEAAPVVPLRLATPSGGYDPLRGWNPGGTRR
ncbi:flagellar hook-length control protein [Mycolicibacterium sp. HK-90]|uniref:flagellar hook-length control protein n=1 Tax=Mycolicibacterium sp. HK-90 TaxID=3056937 RepID=UPI002658CEAC|nr:flagellar hook-length control protein [Mycolicibacterium sp. HK-90]WKG01393.1 flagellar hook-length control protein [Mycolicibacterium sp. HK-90]